MAETNEVDATSKTKQRKHVSRACLECRKRHFKCDGKEPVCDRCAKANKECVYVESHRGGLRKKGVSRKADNKNGASEGLQDIEDFALMKTTKDLNFVQGKDSNVRGRSGNNDESELFDELYKLPCAKDSTKCSGLNCPGKHAVQYFQSRPDGKALDLKEVEILNNIRKRIKLDHSVGNIDCLFANREPVKNFVSFREFDFGLKIHNADHFINLASLNQDDILKKYYEKFHVAHPFFPSNDELLVYLATPSVAREVLLIMQIVGEGETSNIYSKNIDLISDRLIQCLELIKTNNELDLMSIQVLLLVSIVAHISSLHVFSKKLRHSCVHLLQELEINTIDKDEGLPNVPVLSPESDDPSKTPKLFHSSRLKHISHSSILNAARRTYWELYFFDVIIGSADGRTITTLDSLPSHISYPSFPPREVFDYKGRSEAAKLVTDSVKLNIQIIEKKPIDTMLTRMKAAISSWEMKLEEPQMYNSPPLIQQNGTVNEGVHQAILLCNYAKIFVHRPFSFLWKINSPQNPKCGEEVLEAKDLPTQTDADSRAIIETRKTIEAANSIAQVLIDTNASKVTERTPLFACALALASLVHISAYVWVESTLLNDISRTSGLDPSEMDVYAEYIKLSLSAIYPISMHWILSGKLARHIRESLNTLRPQLYSKLKDSLPQIEISIEKMNLGDSINDTSSEPSRTYSTELYDPKDTATVSTSQTSTSVGYTGEPFLNEASNYVEHQRSGLVVNASNNNNNNNNNGNSAITANNVDLHRNSISNLQGYSSFFPSGVEQFDIPLSGQLSPVSDTGCDWIDKALLDYFDGESLNMVS